MQQNITNNITHVITYSRVSTLKQTSTNIQEALLKAEQDAKNELEQMKSHIGRMNEYLIIDSVIEKGTAADKEGVYDPILYMKQRPALYKLYERAKIKRDYKELWCWDWSRFCRSDFQPILVKMFLEFGVVVKVLTGSNDRLGSRVEGMLHAEFIENLRKVAKREHTARMNKGMIVTRLSVGFERNNKGKVIFDRNAEVIKNLFLQIFNGKSLDEVEVVVSIKNIQTNRYFKKTLTKVAKRYILRNKIYIGIASYNETEYKVDIPQLVSEEIFNGVQDRV